MRAEPLITANGWSPPGGRRFAFYSTNAELRELIQLGLPSDLAPWHFTGSDPVLRPDSSDQYWESPWVGDVPDLAAHATGPSGMARANIFAWSEQLTTALPPLELGSPYEALCCFNGFLLIQPSRLRRNRGYSDVAISITERIVNISTREERSYPEYLEVFRQLRRLIRERLVAPGLQPEGSGSEGAARGTMWTRAALAAYSAGTVFDARPALATEIGPIQDGTGRGTGGTDRDRAERRRPPRSRAGVAGAVQYTITGAGHPGRTRRSGPGPNHPGTAHRRRTLAATAPERRVGRHLTGHHLADPIGQTLLHLRGLIGCDPSGADLLGEVAAGL